MSRTSPRSDIPGGTQTPAFGKNLRSARLKAGLSQEELAYGADVDRAAISTYENSKREPNLRTLLKLAQALEVPAGNLLRGL